MEPSALAQELKDGKTIAQVAQEKGVDVNTVIDAMVAPVKERITKFVNEGGPRRHPGATDSPVPTSGTVRSGRGLERHEGVVMPDRTEYATGVPSWVDLQTSDQDAAKRFYGALFGWDYDDMPMPGPGGVYSIARLREQGRGGDRATAAAAGCTTALELVRHHRRHRCDHRPGAGRGWSGVHAADGRR